MDTRTLHYVVTVAKKKHFSKAAEECFVTQPTLSGQIKKMEESLNIKIFERNNRHVLLTPTGKEIVESARRILDEIKTIHEIAERGSNSYKEKLRIGAISTLAAYIFPPLIQKLKKKSPSLKLVLDEGKTSVLTEKLQNGEIDVLLLALPVPALGNRIHQKVLFKDEFFLAAPPNHKLAQCKTISQANLSEYPLLLLEEGHCLRDQALEICRTHEISEEPDFRAASLETLRQMVIAGTGLTLIPKSAMERKPKNISYVPFHDSNPPHRIIGMAWRKTFPNLELIQEISSMLMVEPNPF